MFPPLLPRPPRHRPPDPCEFGFILSCASSSTEFITVPVPAQHPRVLRAFPGVSLSIATSNHGVQLFGGFPMSRLSSARSVSHALDGLLLRSPCKLISSCSHVRDSLFRGCLPLPGQYSSSLYSPLVSLNDVRLQPSCLNCPAPAIPTSGIYFPAAIRRAKQAV